jgi:hypothetical protein
MEAAMAKAGKGDKALAKRVSALERVWLGTIIKCERKIEH